MGDVALVGPLSLNARGPCLGCDHFRVRCALGRPGLTGPHPVHPGLPTVAAQALASAVQGQRLAPKDAPEREATAPGWLCYLWPDGRCTEHWLLRSPHCACATFEPLPVAYARPSAPLAHVVPEDPARIRALSPLIVDGVTGLARWVRTAQAPADAPAVFHAVASVADRTWTQLGQELHSGGSDLDPERALASALGEALDCLGSAAPHPAHVTRGSYAALAERAVDPAAFDVFHPETRAETGFPYAPLDAHAPMSWVWAYSLARQRPLLVPAAQAFVGLRSTLPGDADAASQRERVRDWLIASGGRTRGLLEVIERDTFMIAWTTQLPVARLAIDAQTPWEIGAYVSAFAALGIEVRCSTATLDWGVPVVFAIARPNGPGQPAAVLSASAALDSATACRRALKELTANLAHVRHVMHYGEAGSTDPASIRTQEAPREALTHAPYMFQHLLPWWEPPSAVEVHGPTPSRPHEALLARSGRANRGVWLERVTRRRWASRALRAGGLFTFKVLVPGSYPMNFDAAWPQFGGERLQFCLRRALSRLPPSPPPPSVPVKRACFARPLTASRRPAHDLVPRIRVSHSDQLPRASVRTPQRGRASRPRPCTVARVRAGGARRAARQACVMPALLVGSARSEHLGALLHVAYGVVGIASANGAEFEHRPVPSAGALYPLRLDPPLRWSPDLRQGRTASMLRRRS